MDYRRWKIREGLDISYRWSAMRATFELILGWSLLLTLSAVGQRLGAPWLGVVLITACAILSLPSALLDLLIVLDSLLYITVGQSVVYQPLVKASIARRGQAIASRNSSTTESILIRSMHLAGALVLWRPLAFWSIGFLSRTTEIVDIVWENVNARSKESTSVLTEEAVDVQKETARRKYEIEGLAPRWAADRFRSRTLVGA